MERLPPILCVTQIGTPIFDTAELVLNEWATRRRVQRVTLIHNPTSGEEIALSRRITSKNGKDE